MCNSITGTYYPQVCVPESCNGLIAVEPFKTDAVEKTVRSGFSAAAQKVKLTELKVVHGNANYPTGTIVYVRGDLCVTPDAKKVYILDDVSFIFLPEKEVLLAKKPYVNYKWTSPSLYPTTPYYGVGDKLDVAPVTVGIASGSIPTK